MSAPSGANVSKRTDAPKANASTGVGAICAVNGAAALAAGEAVRDARRKPAAPARATSPAAIAPSTAVRGPAARDVGLTGAGATTSRLCRAIRASPISRSLNFGSRSRQRSISVRRAGGVSAGRRSSLMGSLMTAAIVSVTVSPSKRRSPLSISNSTTPNAQMSARVSTAFPRACSGLM